MNSPARSRLLGNRRLHSSATVFSPAAPTGSGYGKDMLRNAFVEAQKQVTRLAAELPPGVGVVYDHCRW
jgi:hypothetical protein